MDELQVFESGATKCHPSDMYPYTVISIIRDNAGEMKYVVVQADNAVLVSGSFRTYDAVFTYERDAQGKVVVLKRYKDGMWRSIGNSKGPHYVLGHRKFYQAPEV